MGIAKKLAGIEVQDPTGGTHPLGEAWRERPVALVFIRHFG